MKNSLKKIKLIISIIWIIFLCAVILTYLLSNAGAFSVRIIAGGLIIGTVALGSFAVAIMNLMDKSHTVLGAACLFLGFITLVTTIFITESYSLINNPFTPEQFASKFDVNLLMKGTVTYYCRKGPFLYSPQTSEPGKLSHDQNSVHVYKSSIGVSSEFMGGMDFEAHNDAINLKGDTVKEWELWHENSSWSEIYKLDGETHILTYSNSDNVEKQRTLTDEQYNELVKMIEHLPLKDYPEDLNEFRCTLNIQLKSDKKDTHGIYPMYFALVDGEEVCTVLKSYLDR